MTFRNWLRNKWYEHLDELDALYLPSPDYNLSWYFNQYKYWLKREFRHEQRKNNGT